MRERHPKREVESALREAESLGWRVDRYRGFARWSAFGTADGMRNAFVRFPDRRVSIIILTDRDSVNAREIADRIADRLIVQP